MARLHAELDKLLHEEDVSRKLADQGVSPGERGPVPLAACIRSETTSWSKLFKESGATVE